MTVKKRRKAMALILTFTLVFTSIFGTGAAFATTGEMQEGNVIDPESNWCSVSYLREGEEVSSVRYVTNFENYAGSVNVPYDASDVNVQISYSNSEREFIPVAYDENGQCTKELTVTLTNGSTQTYSVTVIREPGDVITLPWIDVCYRIDGESATWPVDTTSLASEGEAYASIPWVYDEEAGITFDMSPEYEGKIPELEGTFTATEAGTPVSFTMTTPDKSITKTFTIYLVRTPLSSDTDFYGNVLADNGTKEYELSFVKGNFEENGGTYTVEVPYGTITDVDGKDDNGLKMIVYLSDSCATMDLPYDSDNGNYVADFELGDDGTYSRSFTVIAENGDQYPAVIKLKENAGNEIEVRDAGVVWAVLKDNQVSQREENAVDLNAAATADGTTVTVPKSIFGQDDSFVSIFFDMQFVYWPDVNVEITYSDGSTFTEPAMDGWVGATLELADVDFAVIKVTAASENGKATKTYKIRVAKEDPGQHAYGEWITDKAADCTNAGAKHRVCSVCGNVEEGVISALNHDKVPHAEKPATCTEKGWAAYETCSRCAYTTYAESGATGHTPGPAATCAAAQKCETCQAVLKAPLGHKAGTAKVTKKATASKAGTKVQKCTVCNATVKTIKIKEAKVSLSKDRFTYTGKNISSKKLPKVVVKDGNGKTISAKSYTVQKPKNVKKMKAIGRYAYKITFKKTCKEYTGSKTVYLQITPKKTSITKVQSAKKAVTVKWKKGKKAQITGYQVMLATNSKFTKNAKTVTIKGYSKTSKKVTKLKAKNKYFVKVRTYKTVKGVKIYSDWSKVKTVKTK